MKEKWVVKNLSADYEKIKKENNISLYLARILLNKGLESNEDINNFLNPNMNNLPSYSSLKDIKKAISRIKRAIDNGEHIRIVGDYDVDGIVSTYLLMDALETLGGFVTYKIPDRIYDGYGISNSIIEKAIEDGIDLIITCDNGIAATAPIALAKESGIDVIVTDHHELKEELPIADCIIDPKQPDCNYENSGICGAYVAALLCEGLYESYSFGKFIENHLDALSLATVCDVMELTKENRVVVSLGLKQLMCTKNLGLKALIEVNELSGKVITSYNLGFVLGPCLNATGRLESAEIGVELLRCKDKFEALSLARNLKSLNEVRKEKTIRGTSKACEIILENEFDKDPIIVVYINNCHESIAGIIAGRIRETFDKPCICLTDSMNDDNILKGSARSTDYYNIFEGLTKVKEHLLKFGGHPLAAGLSLNRNELSAFRAALIENFEAVDIPEEKKVYIDLPVSPSTIPFSLVDELNRLEPFGNGNEKPVFADKLSVIKRISRFGKEGQYLTLEGLDSKNGSFTAKVFRNSEELIDNLVYNYGEDRINDAFRGKGDFGLSVLYYPQINTFNGMNTLEIIINNFSLPNTKEEMKKEIPKKESEGKRGFIFAGVNIDKLNIMPSADDIIVAADSGYLNCKKHGITPNYLVGDFDSLGAEINNISDSSMIIERLPVEKDETDTLHALNKLIELGCDEIYIYGGIGGERFDHSYANMCILMHAKINKVNAYLIDGDNCIMMLHNETFKFNSDSKGDISIFAFGRSAEGVTLRGFKYEISDYDLTPDNSIGVSNSFEIKDECYIKVNNGYLAVIGNYKPE